MTDADLMCPPSKFLAPVGKSRAINEASELLGAFKAFAKLKGTVNKKFVLFMTAGTGEELIGSRQMSQRRKSIARCTCTSSCRTTECSTRQDVEQHR